MAILIKLAGMLCVPFNVSRLNKSTAYRYVRLEKFTLTTCVLHIVIDGVNGRAPCGFLHLIRCEMLAIIVHTYKNKIVMKRKTILTKLGYS